MFVLFLFSFLLKLTSGTADMIFAFDIFAISASTEPPSENFNEFDMSSGKNLEWADHIRFTSPNIVYFVICCHSHLPFSLANHHHHLANMAFNSVSYKDALVARSDFISHPLFLKDGGWAKEGSGHVLASKSAGEDLVGVIVGKVSPHRLQCSPVGNYQVDSKVQPDFTKAKFQFTLDSPDELALKATFRSAVSSLLRLQNNISTTGSNKNLVEGEGDTASVHFSTKIFNKRVCPLFCEAPNPFTLTVSTTPS